MGSVKKNFHNLGPSNMLESVKNLWSEKTLLWLCKGTDSFESHTLGPFRQVRTNFISNMSKIKKRHEFNSLSPLQQVGISDFQHFNFMLFCLVYTCVRIISTHTQTMNFKKMPGAEGFVSVYWTVYIGWVMWQC